MMASRRSIHVQPEFGFRHGPSDRRPLDISRSTAYPEASRAEYESKYHSTISGPYHGGINDFNPIMTPASTGSSDTSIYTSNGYNIGSSSALYGSAGPSYSSSYAIQTPNWEPQGRVSPDAYLDDSVASPSNSDYILEPLSKSPAKSKSEGKNQLSQSSQRRTSNRDEFDGPHQFLQRPPPEYIAQQERDLPHLPTNLVVHEQDRILSRVNDCLSQCAFDFVAKYQFPIPLANGELRPVERPQDREWTEWVYLLKRLATKRRIPARVLYNGQIKQFITILENSLEMRHAAKHQSRPLKDDRNILQLISAGIQVAKLLKDASAMDELDRLYVTTEQHIQDRSGIRYHV